MFASTGRLEVQVRDQAVQIAATATALNGHLNDCGRRYELQTKSLDKLEYSLEKSTEDRRKSIEKLEEKFDAKHKENKKYFWMLLVAVIPIFADKLVSWIGSIPHAGVH